MLEAIIWYLKRSPVPYGKSIIYKIFKEQLLAHGPVWCTYDDNIAFSANLNDRIQRQTCFYGVYRTERRHKAFMRSCIKPGDTIIDVGAHVGYYTLFFAKSVGNNGRVVSFEPNPNNRNILKSNIERNGFNNVELRPEVASDRKGEVELYMPDDENTGNGTLYASDAATQGTITVHSVSTGSLLLELGIDTINMIKIDVEGHEVSVLQGLSNYLSQEPESAPGILVEVNEYTLNNAGKTPKDVFTIMSSFGYSAYRIDEDGKPELHNDPFTDSLVYFSKQSLTD